MTAAREDSSWFGTQVLRRLSGVKRGPTADQYYARCPAHDDKHASLAIKAGDSMPLIYHCHAVPGCDQSAIRAALAGLGVPEEHLGQYGTPQYERRRQIRGTSDDRRELEAARRELAAAKQEIAEMRNDIKALLASGLSLAMLKVRVMATVDDADIPADQKGYVAFAKEAGVSQPRAYATWEVDPLGRPRFECVTRDHVVLARPEEKSQASQVKGHDRLLETRKAGGEPSRTEKSNHSEASRNEKSASPGLDEAPGIPEVGKRTPGNRKNRRTAA